MRSLYLTVVDILLPYPSVGEEYLNLGMGYSEHVSQTYILDANDSSYSEHLSPKAVPGVWGINPSDSFSKASQALLALLFGLKV